MPSSANLNTHLLSVTRSSFINNIHSYCNNLIFGIAWAPLHFFPTTKSKTRFFSAPCAESRGLPSKHRCIKKKKKKSPISFLVFYRPFCLSSLTLCKSLPGSYEVFLLFARSLVIVLVIGVIPRSCLPCRPVVSFVVAEIPVKQEAQSSDRQQDENNNPWKNKAKNVTCM